MSAAALHNVLGAALIVRDEEAHLDRCLTSLAGWCDEIVVVDTGSTDNSVSIAERHGVRMVHQPWSNDFSAARNTGLDLITTKWVLYIDADEQVQVGDVAALRRQLSIDDDVVARTVRFSARPQWTPYREHRLWRNRPDIRFRNAIHETHLHDVYRIMAAEGLRIDHSELHLVHYGYEGDQTRKHRRNLPLLEQQVTITPTRVYLWNHLGSVLASLGRLEDAYDAWRRGIDIVRRDGLKDAVDILVYGSLALALIANEQSARSVIDEGLALDPDHYTLHLADARQAAADRDWARAIEVLTDLTAVDPSDVHRSVLAYNRSMFREWPWQLLGEAQFEAGDHTAAAAAFRTAADLGAPRTEMLSKAALCDALARRAAATTGGV